MKRFRLHARYLVPVLVLLMSFFLMGCEIRNSEPPAPGSIADNSGGNSGEPIAPTVDPATQATATPVASDPVADPTTVGTEATATVNVIETTPAPADPTAPPAVDPTATPLDGDPTTPAQPTPTSTPPAGAEQPTPVPANPPATGEQVHVVQAGENLYRISLRYGTDFNTVARYNNIVNPNLIYVGQSIRIPGTGTHTGDYHVVARGETLASIAHRYGTTINALAAANNIANPNLIYVGQRLLIP